MTDSTRDSIIRKIQKLMQMDGGNATEGEVRNAHEAAQRLMEQHAIEMADLEEGQPRDSIDRDRSRSELAANVSQWETSLAWAVHKMVPGVSWYRSTEYKRTFGGSGRMRRQSVVIWYGPTDLVEIAKNLFDETRGMIATMAQGIYGGVYRGRGRCYAEGFAYQLKKRAEEQARGSEHAQKITDIVLVSEGANKEWLADEHGVKLVQTSASVGGRHFDDAWGEGKKDGANADFTPGKASGKLRSGGRLALPSGD